jgi:hypothetical protein
MTCQLGVHQSGDDKRELPLYITWLIAKFRIRLARTV